MSCCDDGQKYPYVLSSWLNLELPQPKTVDEQPQREEPYVIDADAAAVLTKFAKEIEKRALPLNKWPDKVSPLEARNRNAAWRLTSHLITFLEHAKESDMFIKLYEMAAEKGDDKEMDRCRSIVNQEDRKYMLALDGLKKVLKETKAEEKKDPKAIKYGKAMEAAKVARAANRERDAEEKRARRNAAAKTRRDAAKAEAVAALKQAAGASSKKPAKRSTAKA